MVEVESRKRLDFGLDCGKDIVQRAAERYGLVSQIGAYVERLLTDEAHTAPWLQLHTAFVHAE